MSRQEIAELMSQFKGKVKKIQPSPYKGQVSYGFDPDQAIIGYAPKPRKRRKLQ